MTLGEHLRALRKSKGLTLRQLAECLGKNSMFYNRIELGKDSPSPDFLRQLADFFEVDYERLCSIDKKTRLNYIKEVSEEETTSSALFEIATLSKREAWDRNKWDKLVSTAKNW